MATLSSPPVIGIDIAKKTFQCALLQAGRYQHKQFNNTAAGYHALVQWLARYSVNTGHVGLEATGVYSEALALYLTEHTDFRVSVVNPAKIKGFAQCQLQRLKTDKADAKLIAQYCQAIQPPAWQPTPPALRELQALVKRHEEVGILLRQEKNRLAVAHPIVRSFIQQSIKKVEEEAQQCQIMIKTHIQQHPELNEQAKLLASIPGIGHVTQAQIIAFIGHVERFDTVKQYVAFMGLNPKPYRSGASVYGKTRLSKTGSASLRKAFYMPALVAMKHNPRLRLFSDRLKKNGKTGKTVVCAVMRKLVHLIYGILKSKQPFNPAVA